MPLSEEDYVLAVAKAGKHATNRDLANVSHDIGVERARKVRALEWGDWQKFGTETLRKAKGAAFMYVEFKGSDVTVIGFGGTFERVADAETANQHHVSHVLSMLEDV